MSGSIFDKYYSIPFQKRGCSFDGCNCYGFIRLWYKEELGIDLPIYNLCPSEIPDDYIKSEATNNFFPVTDYVDHDAVIILDNDGKPKHTGIFYQNYILHMSRAKGFLIENFRRIKPRIVSVYRYKHETDLG